MTEWKEYKLGEIAEITPGFAFKSKDFGQIGEKVVKIKDIEPPYIDLTNTDCVDASSYDISKLNKYLLHKGDYVVAMTGATIGKVGKLKTDNTAYINQRVARIRAKNGFSDDFVYFSLIGNDFQAFIQNNIDSNSAQENISANSIGRYPILLPPLETQRRIAAILSSLDDKIDLLHRENATLEQMAETLFRQWFVVEAKEDWEEVPLEYVCERITDGSHYSPESVDLGFPMASVKDMEDWGINLNSCRKISKEEYDKLVSADCLPQVNDILIAKDGSYLKHIFVVNKMQEVVILSSIAIIRPNGLYHPYLLSILLKLDSTKEELKNIVTGAVIPRIVFISPSIMIIFLSPHSSASAATSHEFE